jgi:hypothetical protein
MKFLKRLPLFCALAAGIFIAGCLEVPGTPDVSESAPRISVLLFQSGHSDSTQLQATPLKEFTLRAEVSPDSVKNRLHYRWSRGTAVIADSQEMVIADTARIPDKLTVADDEGNSIQVSFRVLLNTPPQMDSSATPAAGDTLYGNSRTAFTFAWGASEADAGDTLLYTLTIDSTDYSAGALTQVQQSGVAPGNHKFRVRVEDSFGDADTLAWHKFTVIDTSSAAE